MLQPTTISEKLLYSTCIIECEGSVGTGFAMHFVKGNKLIPVMVTNKHVVNNKKNVLIRTYIHFSKGNNIASEESLPVEIEAVVFHHPDPEVDLCCIPMNPAYEQINRTFFKKAYVTHLQDDLIWSDNQLETLEAVEDILMYGYPIGLYDQKHNFPLIRKGITASHPAVDFNGNSIGVIDMSVFPGSSGSPVIITQSGIIKDKAGNVSLGGGRTILLGIVFAVAQYNAQGELKIQEIPTKKQKIAPEVKMPMNIGYYVKAKELLVLKEEVFKSIEKGKLL